MVKGVVFFKDGTIPFVIDDYRMELFTDNSLLKDFSKEYNFKTSYILRGQCFRNGSQGQKAVFLVERSMGSTCYLRCYIINMCTHDDGYDTIGVQLPFLDAIFGYRYKYLDMVREGSNLDLETKDVYKIPFSMNSRMYDLIFRIGHDNRLGL